MMFLLEIIVSNYILLSFSNLKIIFKNTFKSSNDWFNFLDKMFMNYFLTATVILSVTKAKKILLILIHGFKKTMTKKRILRKLIL